MADVEKTLQDVVLQLADLRNAMKGILDETIPQKLEKPWKSFEDVNQDVIDHAKHIIDHLKKNKGAKVDDAMQKDLDVLVRKWSNVNNVYGGLLTVANQCKDVMSTWDKVEKELKKL
jgi:DNA-binding FrmR family transcriptional regulator